MEKEIAALYDERSALDQAIADANQQRSFLISLSEKQLTPQSSTDTVKSIDVTQLTALLDLMGQRLSALAKVIQEAQARQKLIDEKVNELNNVVAMLAPNDASRLEATINVAAQSEMKGVLRVSYRLNEAGWLPYYDARMETPKSGGNAKLALIRRAEVMQSTAETWDNVALTLSTTRPSGATAAPDLTEEELFAYERQRADALAKSAAAPVAGAEMDADKTLKDEMAELGSVQNYAAAPPKAVAQRQAIVQLAGFQANYLIPGRVTVDNSGSAKKVRISSDSHDAKLQVIAVPLIDANAYLTATFIVKGGGPMLPGYVNLYRDGVFVGQGGLPLLNPKEEAKLGFGIDDLVKVVRKEVKKSIGEQGLITTSNVEERAWDITVKNLHDFKIAVKVLDRQPFTARDDVEIETLQGMTPPTQENVDKKRGVLAWSLDLEPQTDMVIKSGYRISWPEGLQIGMTE